MKEVVHRIRRVKPVKIEVIDICAVHRNRQHLLLDCLAGTRVKFAC